MRKPTLTRLASGVLLGLGIHSAFALSGNEQVQLAGTGRYEELRLGLEQDAARAPLKTPELHALCFSYSKTKRYNKLFPCLDQLAAAIAAGDTRTRLFGLDDATPVPHLLRAEAMLELGNYVSAIDEAKKAIAWFRAEGSDDTDLLLNALTLTSMAATLAGDRAEGEKYAQQLEQVSTFTLTGSGYASTKAVALARAYMALGNYQKALDAIESDRLFSLHAFLDKVVSGALLSGQNNWAWQELPRAFMVNRALRGIGKTADAKDGYDRLLQAPQVKDNGEIYWPMLYERGLIAESENNIAEAVDFYKRAIEVIEQQRSSINTEASKIGFIGDKQQVYEHIVDTLYALRRQDEAFESVERSQARALVDMLASREVVSLARSDADAARLLQQADDAESEAVAQVPISAAEGKSAQRRILADAIGRAKASAPELSTLISVSSASIAELRSGLSEAEALVQYYYRGKMLYAMVLTGAELHMVRLDGGGMEDDIRKFRTLMQDVEDGALPLAVKLYDRLVRPIDPYLAKSRRLLIVPHGILHYLPFSALNDGKQYLLEKHALRTLPSASVMRYLRPARPKGSTKVLLYGNPDLGNSKLDLPSAQVEVEEIAKEWKQAKVLVRAAATETSFKADAMGFPMLHIAAHGVFNQKKPLESAVMLSKDSDNDGKLTVAELYSLRLNADLVTLSACETGLGQINSGDDVVGLTRGFLYAGASSVVASLWQVDDDATSELMKHFYSLYARGSKIDALRAAQLEVKKTFPHPYFWSAFYLTGSAQ